MKQVLFREAARDDLTNIHDYIAADNPDAARRVIQAIGASIAKLETFNQLGRTGREPGTFELVISKLPYIVVYEITEDAVEIIAIFHTSQNR